jgi:lysophospholipase L1-like esterase
MKPYKILLFLISIFLVLSFISFIYPSNGIQIGNNLLLRFPDFSSLLTPEEKKHADITEILEYHQLDIVENIEDLAKDSIKEENDSLSISKDSIINKTPSDSLLLDSIKPSTNKNQPGAIRQHLEYPDNNNAVLYPFFDNLKGLKESKELIRILHYGDSQIEGDRISSYIRNELQKQFGGSGIGLFAPVLIKGTNISMKHKLTGSWDRYTIQSIKKGTIFHKRLGALMSFGRFAPENSDESIMYYGDINLKKSNITYHRTRKFKQCRVFYGYNNGPFIAELKYKDKTLDAELIPVSRQLNTLTWDIDETLDEITISFKGEDSPDVYGIALDDHSGVAVDNIPLRGSSGTDFTKTDLVFLRSMYQQLNAKLIILQFGVNLVPYITNDYSYYEKRFYKQLKTLKSLRPDISIIVIGVSDMSQNKNGQYISYPNIEKIRDAQKNAAFKADCAFWDMYEAMGGKNSMPAWVNANPALARTDFTHFTWKGATVISKMFFEALMNDYNQYLNEPKINNEPN